ncbi:helix-turn-helix transcriptional regulator [Aquimarina sp. RZ0]|uniref:helix-turn-helix transcriptional regulator n=1 Tax=Aquimarina sp. RZ0 TaxID=2607730 RepID=UPI0021043462|nr:AraC family transcriptional regulator [Aquimarina sp. RZ0]
MDKKRREATSLKTETNSKKDNCALYAISQLISTQEQCGIIFKKFKFLEEYGTGHFESYHFNGLYVYIFDVVLKKDFTITGYLSKDLLELSFLIEGEQIIKIDTLVNDFIYESQESYLVYVQDITGSIAYHKRKHLKEIKIRMDVSFLKRHRLYEAYDILNRYALMRSQDNFIRPLCSKTQEILSEIISDKKNGLLKRLFLESKILELITLKLDTKKSNTQEIKNQPDKLVKKLYKTQHLISSDLSIQYSIQQLAREIGLNDFALKKEFKRVFGQTIFEYATELRMKKAKQLLYHSTKPIYEISELVGYKNATHFTAAFKKIEGITPKKFRNTLVTEKT